MSDELVELGEAIEVVREQFIKARGAGVRSELVEMLQGIRATETAVAAVEGMRATSRAEVEWVFNAFIIRSLHPTLGAGVLDYFEGVPA